MRRHVREALRFVSPAPASSSRLVLPLLGLALATAACATSDGSSGDDDFADAAGPDATLIDMNPPDAGSSCKNDVTCEAAPSLGTLAGDAKPNGKLEMSGSDAAWYIVRATEDVGSVGGAPMFVRVRLSSSSSNDFELNVYVNTAQDARSCTGPTGERISFGMVDEVHLQWGEGTGAANGSSDTRDVAIEIKPTSGVCSPSQPWNLVVEGGPL